MKVNKKMIKLHNKYKYKISLNKTKHQANTFNIKTRWSQLKISRRVTRRIQKYNKIVMNYKIFKHFNFKEIKFNNKKKNKWFNKLNK